MADIFNKDADDDSISCLIITGSGDYFSSGADLKDPSWSLGMSVFFLLMAVALAVVVVVGGGELSHQSSLLLLIITPFFFLLLLLL